jgi:hypothetical protein
VGAPELLLVFCEPPQAVALIAMRHRQSKMAIRVICGFPFIQVRLELS